MSSVVKFFENRTVFVTGGLGFLGKLVIEKLLRSCPMVKQVILLIRPKKHLSVEERIHLYLKDPNGAIREIMSQVFQKLKETNPLFPNKLTFYEGDIKSEDLGLKSKVIKKLEEDVDVVLHLAATVNFSNPLLEALDTNYFGTKHVLDLSLKMQNLKSFVYVSTAYANCDQREAEEILYPILPQSKQVVSLRAKLLKADAKESKEIEERTLGVLPNTYTFSKRLTEFLVQEYQDKMPMAIVRPSVVGATYKEPKPGFIDNYAAATGIFYLFGSGEVRSIFANPEKHLDLVPADLCVNTILAAATARSKLPPGNLPIYHSSAEHPFTYGQLSDSIKLICTDEPLPSISGTGGSCAGITNSKLRVDIEFYIFKFLPALVSDIIWYPWNREFRNSRLANLLYKKMSAFDYITGREFVFKRDNVTVLYDGMTPEDRINFPLKSTTPIKLQDYMQTYLNGIREATLQRKRKRF